MPQTKPNSRTLFGIDFFLRRGVQGRKSWSIEKTDVGDQLGLGINVDILFDIFKIDPFVMAVPAIQRDDGIAVPVRAVVQKNGRTAPVAKAMNFDCISCCLHL
jgi:hypothetical protein